MDNLHMHMARSLATARFLLGKDGERAPPEVPGSDAVQQATRRPGQSIMSDAVYRRQDNVVPSSWDSAADSANNIEALTYLRRAAPESPTPGPLRRRLTVDVLQSPPGTAVGSPVTLKDRRRSELERLDLDATSSPSAGRKGVSFNLDASTYEDPVSGTINARLESPFKQQAGVSAGGILSSWSAGHSALVARSGSAGKNRSNSALSMRPAADSAASAGAEYKLPLLGKQQGCQGNSSSSIRPSLAAAMQQSPGVASGTAQPPGKASQAVSPTGPRVISGSHSHIRPVNNHKTGYKTQSLGFKPRIAPVGLINERAAMAACELDSTRYDKVLGKLDKEVVAADQRVYGCSREGHPVAQSSRKAVWNSLKRNCS